MACKMGRLETAPDNQSAPIAATEPLAVTEPRASASGPPQIAQAKLADQFWEDMLMVFQATRSWIQYGALGFAVLCIIVGAVEGLFGK
jgi:hypothetical protein